MSVRLDRMKGQRLAKTLPDRGDDRPQQADRTFGVHVGNAVIEFWFQGLDFDCMRRVDITPADATLSRLTLD